MGIQLETGSDCGFISTALGLRVWIRNTGGSYAVTFVVEAAGAQQRITSGLGPGQRISLWFPGYAYAGEQTVAVDATFQVEESNEDNNSQTRRLPIPTLPPTCTPTSAQAPGVSNLSSSTFLAHGSVGRGTLLSFILTLVNQGSTPVQATVSFQQLGRSDYAEPLDDSWTSIVEARSETILQFQGWCSVMTAYNAVVPGVVQILDGVSPLELRASAISNPGATPTPAQGG